jgi:PilZ domain
MMVPSRPQEVAITPQGYVAFTCPYCRTSRTASVARYRDLHAPITVECACEELFDILVDTRQFYRQHLHLRGTYIPLESTTPQPLIVKTLSASGVSFHTMLVSPLQVDDEVTLWFQLDDIWQTAVHLRAIVRWVQDETVGAEFCEHHGYEQVLSSYLCLRQDTTNPSRPPRKLWRDEPP